ncbi:MAG: 1-acyl-sn-glycerol-3-phosphate acyltransferase [Desulfobulbaceae bacterium]|nr:1-acyl-sn-glycerol-3-phosphate acyltransferase [Desulfobulbaceae bacterium]
MKKLLLNLYFWPFFSLITLIGISLIPFAIAVNSLIGLQSYHRLLRRGIRGYGWILVRLLPFMAPVALIDKSGGLPCPAIYVANHCSSVDPYLFGSLAVENGFVTSWPFKIPVLKWIMRGAQYIDSNKGWDVIQNQAAQLLTDGCSLIIWPEGHRSRNGEISRFKNGAFHLSCLTNTPIIPVCIKGSGTLMEPGARLLTPARVSLTLLPPVFPDGAAEDVEYIKKFKTKVKEMLLEEQQYPSGNYKPAICPPDNNGSSLTHRSTIS